MSTVVRGGHGRRSGLLSKISPIFLFVGLAACGVTRDQLDTIGAFGKSTVKLSDGVKQAYVQADQNEVDIRLAQQIASVSTSVPSKILENYRKRRFDVSTGKIKGRIAAADTLAAYGIALATLVDSKTQDSDFSDAVTSLSAAVKGLPQSFRNDAGITDDDVAGVGSVVVAFGKIALDARRREVLEDVVPAAEPMVTKICQLFARDFSLRGGTVAGIVSSEVIKSIDHVERVFTNKDIAAPAPGREVETGATFKNRAVMLPMIEKLRGIQVNSSAAFQSLSDAAQSCVKASGALAIAVKDPKLTLDDIIDFVGKAQSAFSAVKNLTNSKAG